MENGKIINVPEIMLGIDSSLRFGGKLKALKVKKTAIITTPGTAKRGAAQKISDVLSNSEVACSIFDGAPPEPTLDAAEKALSFIKENNCDSVIGVGGGSAMDVAKAAALAATNNGVSNCAGINKAANPSLPLVLIPTTAGTGSEATNVSVVTDRNGKKIVIYSNYIFPSLAVVDPMLQLTIPKDVTAHSGMDTVTHAIEAYLSVNSTTFGSMAALQSIKLSSDYLLKAYNEPSDIEARQSMALAALLGGMAISANGVVLDGCPIAGAGIAHAIGLTTGAKYGIPHGLAVGMVLPHAMEFLHDTSKQRLEDIAQAALGERNSKRAIYWVEGMLVSMDMQRTIRAAGKSVGPADVDSLADGSMLNKRLLMNASREVSKDDLAEIIGKVA